MLEKGESMYLGLKRLGLGLLVLLSMGACQEVVVNDEVEVSFGLPGKRRSIL